MTEPKKNEMNEIGCEIANNRFSLHYSRKTDKPKTAHFNFGYDSFSVPFPKKVR